MFLGSKRSVSMGPYGWSVNVLCRLYVTVRVATRCVDCMPRFEYQNALWITCYGSMHNLYAYASVWCSTIYQVWLDRKTQNDGVEIVERYNARPTLPTNSWVRKEIEKPSQLSWVGLPFLFFVWSSLLFGVLNVVFALLHFSLSPSPSLDVTQSRGH